MNTESAIRTIENQDEKDRCEVCGSLLVHLYPEEEEIKMSSHLFFRRQVTKCSNDECTTNKAKKEKTA